MPADYIRMAWYFSRSYHMISLTDTYTETNSITILNPFKKILEIKLEATFWISNLLFFYVSWSETST